MSDKKSEEKNDEKNDKKMAPLVAGAAKVGFAAAKNPAVRGAVGGAVSGLMAKKSFDTAWYLMKMNSRLPKQGSLDGVLARNPDPPSMNAGMPRDPDLLARLKRMHEAKKKQPDKKKGTFER